MAFVCCFLFVIYSSNQSETGTGDNKLSVELYTGTGFIFEYRSTYDGKCINYRSTCYRLTQLFCHKFCLRVPLNCII